MVTGGSGFLGQPLLNELSSAGYQVLTVQRGSTPVVDGVESVEGDVQNFEEMLSLMGTRHPKLLIHLAWTTEHGQFWDDRENMGWVASTIRLLEAFAENGGQRFIGLGSCAEYDWSLPGPYREDEVLTPTADVVRSGEGECRTRNRIAGICSRSQIDLGPHVLPIRTERRPQPPHTIPHSCWHHGRNSLYKGVGCDSRSHSRG